MRRNDYLRFAYRLAREVGHTVHVHRMLRSMTAVEFSEWVVYYRLEPSLDQRMDWLVASVREMVFNMAVDVKNRKPVKDFLLKFNDAVDEVVQRGGSSQTWEQQKALMLMALGFKESK